MALENTTEPTVVRPTGKRDGLYTYTSNTIAGGVTNTELDIDALLVAAGRGDCVGPARYLVVTTDVAITVRINAVTSDAIPVTSTTALTIPLNVLAIYSIFLSSAGACGSGAATVKVLAA